MNENAAKPHARQTKRCRAATVHGRPDGKLRLSKNPAEMRAMIVHTTSVPFGGQTSEAIADD
ncbi:MAG: hypothetical protein P8J37_08820 [Fuerstiella sp.]|nr:hypothetical protein [Fuerstiella sp.]